MCVYRVDYEHSGRKGHLGSHGRDLHMILNHLEEDKGNRIEAVYLVFSNGCGFKIWPASGDIRHEPSPYQKTR